MLLCSRDVVGFVCCSWRACLPPLLHVTFTAKPKPSTLAFAWLASTHPHPFEIRSMAEGSANSRSRAVSRPLSLTPWKPERPQQAVSKLCTTTLTDNDVEDDEVIAYARSKKSGATGVSQTMKFTDLPAELRNRIYEFVLPSDEEDLIVAIPFKDGAMSMGSQPAITRTSRMIRNETLPMFYATARFVAYVDNINFTDLAAWCRTVAPTVETSLSAAMRPIDVHVKMITRPKSSEACLQMMRLWSRVPFDNFHLRVHTCYSSVEFYNPRLDVRGIVVRAIEKAEEMARKGLCAELDSSEQHLDPAAGNFLDHALGVPCPSERFSRLRQY